MHRVMLPAAMLACVFAAACANAFKHHAANSGGEFDYYLLSLSWAPNYCAGRPTDQSLECRAGQHANFVLHGLWPQSNTGQPPLNCGSARPVSSAIVRHMLQYFPSRGLIQHEWTNHGTCSGLSAQDYFSKVEQAYNQIKIPDQYRNLDHIQTVSVQELEWNFATANRAPAGAFRVSCHAGEVVGVEVCLDKELKVRACTAGAGECPAQQVLMRPVR